MLSEFVEKDVETEASVEAAQTYGYWLSLRPDGLTMPCWRDFDWMQMPVHMICCCGVVDVVGGDAEFVYRFWGTQHADMHHQEMTNRSIHEMRPSAIRDVVLDQYRIVRDSAEPRLFTSSYRSRLSAFAAREYSLRLPFSDDGQTVSHIFALSDIQRDFDLAQEVCETSDD